ncbi:MAG: hypothetical protein WBA97_36775 [Actinophytocola sp.]|uniref:hypothetical protein n=1 Tax=Actinophytocola sp. TaxID=1872138 RepID=UPI003C75300E
MGRHSDPAWPGDLLWRQSPWNHFVHAFPQMGEISSAAICDHCAPTSRLIDPLPGGKPCLACLLLHGGDLADTHEERDRWT